MEAFVTKTLAEEPLPLVIEPKQTGLSFQEFLEQIQGNSAQLKKELLKHGGLLFRNFPVETAHDFSTIIDTLRLGTQVNYIGGDSPRTKVVGSVYTSTEAPPPIKIPLHNEMSFVKNHPGHIYFFCEVPPKEGGETFIGDARKINSAIDPDVRNRFIDKGLKYISRYYYKSQFMDLMNKIQKGHKTWIDVFETESKEDVEQKCRDNEFGLRWLKNDWVEISQERPPVKRHPETQEEVWFNQVHLYDYNPKFIGWMRYIGVKMFYCLKDTLVHETTFADGTKIPREDLYHIMDVLDDQSIYFPWQKGDVLVLDNVLAMHGRAPFQGKRRILAALTS